MGQSNAVPIDLIGPSGVVTHVISDPSLRTATGLDLERIRSYPEVQFAALLEGGMMALGCPDGLPEALIDIAQDIERPPPDAASDAPQPSETSPLDQHMLDFAQKLDDFMARQHTHDVLSARMTAFEGTLTEVLARQDVSLAAADVARAQTAATLQTLCDKLDQQLDAMAEKTVRQSEADTDVAEALKRLEAQAVAPSGAQEAHVDLDPVLSAIEGLGQQLQNLPAPPADPSEALAALHTRLDQIGAQPAPQLDLTPQRKNFAQFQTVLSTALKRFENVAAIMEAAAEPSEPSPELAGLADRFDALPLRVAQTVKEEMETASLRVDLSGVEQELSRLGQTPAQLPASFDALVEQVSALQKRPDPVLNLTEQRRSFANFATAFGAAIARMESLSDRFATQEPSAGSSEVEQNITARLDRIEALLSDQAGRAQAEPQGLSDAIRHLADQMQPQAAQQCQDGTADGPTQSRAMQEAFLEDLRVTFAELIASQLKAQGNST